MKKRIPCVFGKEVLNRLMDKGMTQSDLIAQVKSDTGLYIDSSYMSRIIYGQRNAPKIVSAICKILEIPDNKQNSA